MNSSERHSHMAPAPMKRETFNRFRAYIEDGVGIKMPDVKKTMLQSRFQKRLRCLGLRDYDAYCDLVFGPDGNQELQNMIDVVTTNKTDFFREPSHFHYLVEKTLPAMAAGKKSGGTNVWCAGCATGEEAYTLAMVLSEYKAACSEFDFSILATDISSKVLKEAVLGIYQQNDVEPVPHSLKKKYLLRSKDKREKKIRVKPELRSRVRFRQLNFMSGDFGIHTVFDIIFCRNVLIYFNKKNQEGIVNRLCRQLKSGGYLFIGHSETLGGLRVPLKQEAATIYRKTAQREEMKQPDNAVRN